MIHILDYWHKIEIKKDAMTIVPRFTLFYQHFRRSSYATTAHGQPTSRPPGKQYTISRKAGPAQGIAPTIRRYVLCPFSMQGCPSRLPYIRMAPHSCSL